ncbi:hydroxyphenylacetyl-CoA thioesterase PaaI [Rhodovulum adriaticum]|uniref:Acyl-CoA thioesterase n=1 Tax=Rhodovulum adriaticum TaxID=35804 RepID=A0A4R2NWF3_RHOAD|nr:hydroxyphenylacetyl-CoA thioesterase PaaI [Rhodovulum adriaticum]MBK1636428.1 phenylacetic acid degradation protein PaaD [Rhodovulum adriaticum]TCP26483.1 acyl-CoA thioesterase [Rhodovulum adriaticum]
MTPQDRANRCAAAMTQAADAVRWMGIELVEIAPGAATMCMTIAPHHANGHRICHGGVIFTLADTAFAYACNSRNVSTVAQHGNISFIAPAHVGDVLTATAAERALSGKNGIYDIRVARQDGTLIAEMRGLSRAVRGQWFTE